MSIDQLRNELSRYRVLLNEVNNAISALRRVINVIGPAESIETIYTIDDISADNKIVNENKDKILNASAQLTNIVIPAINSKISDIERRIVALEQEDS